MKNDCRDCTDCENLSDGRCKALDGTKKRGRWLIAINTRRRFAPVSADMLCSSCRVAIERIDGVNYAFCPNCGTEMREEDVKK